MWLLDAVDDGLVFHFHVEKHLLVVVSNDRINGLSPTFGLDQEFRIGQDFFKTGDQGCAFVGGDAHRGTETARRAVIQVIAEFFHCRNVGQLGITLGGIDGERPQVACFDLLKDGAQVVRAGIDLAAHCCGHRRTVTIEGNFFQGGACQALQENTREEIIAANTRITDRERVRIGLGRRKKLFGGFLGAVFADDQDTGAGDDVGERLKLFDVVFNFRIKEVLATIIGELVMLIVYPSLLVEFPSLLQAMAPAAPGMYWFTKVTFIALARNGSTNWARLSDPPPGLNPIRTLILSPGAIPLGMHHTGGINSNQKRCSKHQQSFSEFHSHLSS